MRVAVYYNNKDVRLEERPIPKIGNGELLVKIIASGICGSDVMEWYRIKKAPIVLGHEATGVIAQVGRQVSKYKAGDRVFVAPLACVLRGQRIAGFKKGQRVIILGAGISGLLHLLLARANGAKKLTITDINEFRLKKAKELGADNVINAKDNLGELADLVIICTSAQPAFLQALKCVDRAGTILMFAPTEPCVTLPLPVNDFWRQNIKIVHSYGASPDDTTESVELLRKKCLNVNSLITHRLKLKDAGLGFTLFLSAKDCIKVILEP